MTNITFDDNLITGNDTIDTQHEELINRIQQFVAACESGDGKVKAIKMYDFLNENEGPNAQFIEQVKINVVDWLFKHIKTFDRSVAEYIHLNNNAERL